MRSALVCDITQRIVLIPYWRFGTTYRSHFQGSSSPRWDPIVCYETSVTNYHYTLRNIAEKRRSQIYGNVLISIFIVVLMCVCARVYFSGWMADNRATDIHFQAATVVRSVILTSVHGVYYWTEIHFQVGTVVRSVILTSVRGIYSCGLECHVVYFEISSPLFDWYRCLLLSWRWRQQGTETL